jgi:hypothetical protein
VARVAAVMRVLRNDFPGLPKRTRAAVVRGLDASGKRVADGARAKTPPRVESGAMMEGYYVEVTGELTRAIQNRMPYHVFHELGTATIAPHPMITAALAEERPRFVDAVAAELRRELR